MRHHGYKTRGIDTTPQSPFFEGRFGRMFRGLPVHDHDLGFLRDLADGLTGRSGDNPAIPAGFTYLGQFIDHDLTFDPTSSLERQNDPDGLVNFRSPRFDLDCLYGRGPDDQPYLYEQPAAQRFLLGRLTDDDGTPTEGFGAGDDLQRNAQGRALIGDPRNDENTFVSQLQLSFLKLHNKLVDQVEDELGDELDSQEVFREAQRRARWHYQWIVVHDFLPRIVGAEQLDSRLETDDEGRERVKLSFYRYRQQPYMPIEFSVAAYRFGHSQIRARYDLNAVVQDLPIFTPGPLADRRADFRGFRPLPGAWTADWTFFFDLDGNAPQPTLLIDSQVSRPMFDLPEPEFDIPGAEHADERSLARRNLIRGKRVGLPSGHRVANAMGVPKKQQLTREQLGFRRPCPLWFYILKEAEVLHGGAHLGPVGGGIVAETFLGILAGDPLSYLSQDPAWKPTLPAADPSAFALADLLRFAVPEQTERVASPF